MHSSILTIFLGLLPCLIPPYALRLSRRFGMKRVGWGLFAVFSLMAVLELIRFWQPLGLSVEPGVVLDLLNFLVPALLLTGMVHIELFLRERLARERQQEALAVELERQVKERTAELDKTNEELQREISLRRQGEEELRKSKEQYRFLFEQNPLPMWIYDLNTFRFLAFNAAALRHYGFTGAEFGEMDARALCVAGEAEAFSADSGSTGPGAQRRGLWHHRKKDGTEMEVELTSLDLVYGSAPARLVLAHDVTARRRLHKQLLDSQKQEVTVQLAGGVADRFNKLISGLEAEAQVLVQMNPEPATADALKRIAANAASATSLTHQLLALVGRHPMQPRAVDLNALLEEQTGRIKALLGQAIVLENQFRANLPSIQADPSLVCQLVEALVCNAREAMTDGGKLTLSTSAVRLDEAGVAGYEEARPGAFVCFTVADTGCGMTPEVQERLFEPFFTTKTSAKANGLGLATVHGLVKQHHGWLKVNSRPGAGTQVTVFLPCGVGGAVPRRTATPQQQYTESLVEP